MAAETLLGEVEARFEVRAPGFESFRTRILDEIGAAII